MKNLKIIIPILLITLSLSSCKLWLGGYSIKKHGYVTDTLGVGIANVKLTVLVANDFFEYGEETELVYFTDENGYYELSFGYDIDKVYRLKPTHDDYIYVLPQNTKYPQITVSDKTEQEQNFEMVKLGKVKIEGGVRYTRPDLTDYWMENVKISLLKRSNGDTNYPTATGIETFSDDNGLYYIEFEGDENYEFFLKPEKEGYYYDYYGTDYIEVINQDQGYVDKQSFFMEKEN